MLHAVTVLALAALVFGVGLIPQIPSIEKFTPAAAEDYFSLSSVPVHVDEKYAKQGSPSLEEFAQVFVQDLTKLLGDDSVSIFTSKSDSNGSGIFITLGATGNHTLYNGRPTGEGYEFQIPNTSYVIRGVDPIGAWWGTRTLLQQVALQKTKGGPVHIPAGAGSDTPGWEVRGFMLDAGRHWFRTSFLTDLCTYASFFKINEFHIHASDFFYDTSFLYGGDWRALYTGFRFRPSVGSAIEGLVPRRNESWSRDEFTRMQSKCALHGVSLIPEIDTPGHALVISQWKPELSLPDAPDQLNLSYPETIPTIKSIWEEFLPWFDSPEVSIGADEYNSSLANDYIAFVNDMADFVLQKTGKSIRIWGTNEPSKTMSVSKNITIQHWDFPGDDIPVRLLQAGYQVINSEQYFLYLEGKIPGESGIPQQLNQTRIWNGAPGGKGWAPNIFSPNYPSNNTSIDNPHLRGSIFALWNDWGNNATTELEIYYQFAESLALFGEKTWAGSETRSTGLTREQFSDAYPSLNAFAPGQNLNRVVSPKNGNVIYSYSDIHSVPLDTQVDSVGPPYTLKFAVKPSSTNISGVLFSGQDSTLHAENLTFESSTGQFYSLNYTLPAEHYTVVEIHATRTYTYAIIDGAEHWWITLMDIWGDYMAVGNISFAAPSRMIGDGSFDGDIKNVTLTVDV